MFAMVESKNETYDLIVIGGGAAGFFGAILCAEMRPDYKILILEKSNKVLAKVKVSGGGRCNVTHHCFQPGTLAQHYPRGERSLKEMFKKFQASDTVDWFKKKGVSLKTEEDGRMFPTTDDSQTVIDCFMREVMRHKVKIEMGVHVTQIEKTDLVFDLTTHSGRKYQTQNVLVATGGNPNSSAYDWLRTLGHNIISPIPSLFTFNDSEKKFKDLMGVAVPKAEVKIASTKFEQSGPLLITHWGLSGPAVIKLSAWAAEYLHEKHYDFTALISWIGTAKEDEIREQLLQHKSTKGKQKIISNPLYDLPLRLWVRLCELSGIEDGKIWAELPQKNLNRLLEFLIRCPFKIKGKTTFKEEFVTCGGIDLKEVNLETMESKKVSHVYFAGELLNIDGETGGFNFQAAWTTAYLAAKGITSRNPG